MIKEDFNPSKALQQTRMIYFSLIAGSLTYLILVFYIATENLIFMVDLIDTLFLSLFIFSLLAIPSGYLYSRKIFNKIDPDDLLSMKYPVYQTGLIIRLATCEGVAIFSVVCLLLTNNLFSIIFFLIALIVMIANYPSPDRIGREINLTQSEIDRFYV